MKGRGVLAWTAAALLLVLAGVLGFSHFNRPPLTLGPAVSLMEDGRELPEFRLSSTQGEFSNANLRGRWTFLLFGYTHCPDVCPTNLALLASVVDQIKGRVPAEPQVVFVSVDAPRDSLDVLRRYVPAFHSGFIGATGDDAALKPFTKGLGVYFVRNVGEGPGGTADRNYSVDHTSSIFLVAPNGGLRAAFRSPLEARRMADDTAAIITH